MYGRRWQFRHRLDMNPVLLPRALNRSPAALSACQNSPAATACQYDEYIVPMPYLYYLHAEADQYSALVRTILYTFRV